MRPAVSPDGKLVACLYLEPGKFAGKVAIFPFEGRRPVKVFPLPAGGTSSVAWTPDGRGLVYAENPADDATTLWVQPLEGGALKSARRAFAASLIRFTTWLLTNKILARL